MNMTEKLEVSIFKDISHEKTIIAAVMDPSIPNGVGPMLMRLPPRLKTMIDGLRYTGKVRFLESGADTDTSSVYAPPKGGDATARSYLTPVSHLLTFDANVIVFGGTAYHLHKVNDNSPFSHILPGVHDVDVNVDIVVHGFPPADRTSEAEHPANNTSVHRLVEGIGNSAGVATSVLEQPDSILSFLLNNMVSTIRNHILDETRSTKGTLRDYEHFVNGKVNKVRLNPPYIFDDDTNGLLYSEIVANFFRIKIVLDRNMLKVQVEIKARDSRKRVSAMDHAFEAIIGVSDTNMNWKKPHSNTINGIQVKSKRTLFDDNLASLIDRVASIKEVGNTTFYGRLFAGKCAQDFLRVVYILLDGLQEDKPRWVEARSMTKMFNVRAGGDIRDAMMIELGKLGTPIEVFLFISSYIEPCITASRIRDIDVFQRDQDIKRTRTIGRDFRDIIDAFKFGFAIGEDLLKERAKLERMMVVRHVALREQAKTAGSKVVAMRRGAEQKGKLGYYFNKDFDLTLLIEMLDDDTGDEFSGDVRFLRRDGVLTVSGPTYSNGAVLSVARHGDKNAHWYKVVLEDGTEMSFSKITFMNAFKEAYPDVPEPVFDENVWYKQWLKNTR